MISPHGADLPGHVLRDAFAGATQALALRRDAVNALNIFPVPDGDTGTNLLLTMRSAMEQCAETADITACQFFKGLADGAFWGARGNSGVIFSQFLAGMAKGFRPEVPYSGGTLEKAFRLGAAAAYKSVGTPVEGTMLTVLNSLAPAVLQRMEEGETSPGSLWEAAFNASQDALAKTPEQLPILKEAGVVDAGGMGVVVILGGVLEGLTGGEYLDPVQAPAETVSYRRQGMAGRVDQAHLDKSMEADWGYCIQFVIKAQDDLAVAPDEIRDALASGTMTGGQVDSAVVAGDEDAVRVHVHAPDPATVLNYGSSLGALYQVSVQSMDQQNQRFAADTAGTEASKNRIAVIAVASGDGLAGLFLQTGCARVVSGGQSMNPSVEEILESCQSSGAEYTILLPNNPNVVAAALQAAACEPHIHVVESRTIPEGVAALLAFLPQTDLEENLAAMEHACSFVKSIEVTSAARSATIGGVAVESGQYLTLIEGELATVGDTAESALKQGLKNAGLTSGGLITLYVGADAGWRQAQDLAAGLKQQTEGIDVELVYGGQPHYPYLASVE